MKIKRWVLITVIVLIIVVFTVGFCYQFGYEQPFNHNWLNHQPSVAASEDRQAVAEALMKQYLSYFDTWAVGLQCRIVDFRIMDIKVTNEGYVPDLVNDSDFEFIASYDVHMAIGDSDWMAGNGDLVSDYWMVGKSARVIVAKLGARYVMKSIGTGR